MFFSVRVRLKKCRFVRMNNWSFLWAKYSYFMFFSFWEKHKFATFSARFLYKKMVQNRNKNRVSSRETGKIVSEIELFTFWLNLSISMNFLSELFLDRFVCKSENEILLKLSFVLRLRAQLFFQFFFIFFPPLAALRDILSHSKVSPWNIIHNQKFDNLKKWKEDDLE